MKFLVILISLFCISTVSSVSYTFEIHISPGIQVWKTEECKAPVEVPYNKFMEFSFNDAFIVMYKSFNLEVDVFYWLGANISMEKRRHTAYCAGFLVKQFSEETPHVPISSISREVDGIESKAFARIFNLTPGYLQKLYRVTGSIGQHIMQVQCSYEELNKSDSFVLDCKDGIYVWNSHYSKYPKRKMAAALARRINRIQNEESSEIFTLSCGPRQNPTFYVNFISGFLGNISNAVSQFPHNTSTESDNNLKQTRHRRIILKKYSMVSNKLNEKIIESRPLQLNMFEKDKAYIMKVFYNQNTFVYLGENAKSELIPKVLARAEKSFYNESQHDNIFPEMAWKKITVIYGNQNLPTHFLVNFDEELDKLRQEITIYNN